MRRTQEGQTLVLVALVLAFLAPLVFLAIDTSERMAQIAFMEDALGNAARVGVQTFRYQEFSEQSLAIVEETAVTRAREALRLNIRGRRGMTEDAIEDIVGRTTWTVNEGPSVCGQVVLQVPGFGLSSQTVQRRVEACATLDVLRQ